MLAIHRLDYRYGPTQVLNGIDVIVPEPGLIGLLGHNGSGKSTLLRILGATLPAQSGDITIFGEKALDHSRYIARALRHRIGVLFQSTSSDPLLSARDNLFYFARLMGLPRAQHQGLVEQSLRLSNLVDRASQPLKNYSQGMRRRLEIYRTFMHKPRLVLLDEPTEGLDFVESARFWSFVKDYSERERALILIATHRAGELEHCNQVVMLHQGFKIAQADPQTLLASLNYYRVEVTLSEAECGSWQAPAHMCFQLSPHHPQLRWTQVRPEELSTVLNSQALHHKAVRSVRWSRPELSDAYHMYGAGKQ